jgi:hypothetical protein
MRPRPNLHLFYNATEPKDFTGIINKRCLADI